MPLFLVESFARLHPRRIILATLTFILVAGHSMVQAAEGAPPIPAQSPATPVPPPAPTNAPPSVPAAPFHPVNLQPFYSVRFSTGAVAGIWTPVPRGLQVFAGVPFEIGGKVEITGLDEARHGRFHSARVSGISIGRRAARLHLLHGAAHGGTDGVPLYQLLLHFAGGEQRAFRLAYGVHARNWLRDPDERRSRPDDPESAIVWSNPAAGAVLPEGRMRFFKTALLNPLPDREIVSVELISFFSKATPIVFALTLEDRRAVHSAVEGTERKSIEDAVAFEDSAYVGELRVRLRHAAAGAPVTNAAVNVSISDGGPPFHFGEYLADATGVARVPYPAQHAAELHVQARAPGMAPEMTSVGRPGGTAFPGEIELRLTRGNVGGGVVRGAHGPPVPNASVLLVRDQPSAPGEFIAVAWDRVTTDAAGRWSSTALPADPAGFRLQVSHPEYEPATYTVAASGGTSGSLVTRDDLLGSKSEMRLKPFLRIAGQLVESSGRAAPNAFLFLLSGDKERRRIWLGSEGRFSFFADETGPAALLAAADGFAPQIVPIHILPGLAPIRVTLQSGYPLRLLVRDAAGLAVSGAVVSLDSWNARDLIPWRSETDAAGRVVWTNAPAGGLELRIQRAGFQPAHLALASPADREVEITLRRAAGLFANIVDAGSKAPLDSGWATLMHRKSPQDPWRWERGQASRFRQGRLPMSVTEMPGAEVGILVESPGYLPAMVGPLTQNTWQTNQIELRRGGGWRGAVVAPDGSPAPKASVALAETGDVVQLDASASLRVRGFGEQQMSQNAGEYEFNARPGAPTLFAAHPAGFACVSAEQAAKDGKIALQPWGHVRGSLGLGEKTALNVWVALSSFDSDLENVPMAPPSMRPFLRTRPDNKGNFAFDRVPPGEWRLAVAWRNAETPQSLALGHGMAVTVQSGQTNEVKLGEPGRTVAGRFVVEGAGAREVDWLRDTPMLMRTMPGAPAWPEADLAAAKSDADRRALLAGFEQKLRAFRESESGRVMARSEKNHALLVSTNGEFRAEHVPPGQYILRAAITGPSLREPGTTMLGVIHRIVEIASATNGTPQELGEIKIAIAPVPRVGAPLPPLPLQAPDGQPVNLATFRGKWLLLDFWTSSDRGRGYAQRQLRNLIETPSARDRLVVLSVNVDPNPLTWLSWRQSTQESWPQARAASWEALPASLGLGPATPALLLDPEGRIAARPATLENARALVRRSLALPERQ